MSNKFRLFDSIVLIVVHHLDEFLGLIRDDPVQDEFRLRDDIVSVFIGGPENARSGLASQVAASLHVFLACVFAVSVDVRTMEVTQIFFEGVS